MDLKTAQKHYKDLWTWISQNPGKYINDWPEWESNSGKVPNIQKPYVINPFPCKISNYNCENCPINWKPFEDCIKLVQSWAFETMHYRIRKKDFTQLVKIAEQLSNMPWKE